MNEAVLYTLADVAITLAQQLITVPVITQILYGIVAIAIVMAILLWLSAVDLSPLGRRPLRLTPARHVTADSTPMPVHTCWV